MLVSVWPRAIVTQGPLRRLPAPPITCDARELVEQMADIKKPCIVCGLLVIGASRCRVHQLAVDNARWRRRGPKAHYQGTYRARAAKVRASATHCWICGDTAREGDPWAADHVTPGDPASELRPAHRSCNGRRGNGRPTRPTPAQDFL